MEVVEKYPKRFQYVPHQAYADSDNKIFDGKIIHDVGLEIKPEFIGVNQRHRKPPGNLKWGCIYILNAKGTDLYKVGISSNFRRRYRDLVAASPLPIVVCKYAECDHPHLLEDKIYEMFKHRYFKNEWYYLTFGEFKTIEAQIDKYYER